MLHPSFIWSVADMLRGDYKQSEYGKVSLPFTVLTGVGAAYSVAFSPNGHTLASGNADGTIPAWDGGITTPPPGYKPGMHQRDPCA